MNKRTNVKKPKIVYIALGYKYKGTTQLSYIPSSHDTDFSKYPHKIVKGVVFAKNIRHAEKIFNLDRHFILQINYKEFRKLVDDGISEGLLEGWKCTKEGDLEKRVKQIEKILFKQFKIDIDKVIN